MKKQVLSIKLAALYMHAISKSIYSYKKEEVLSLAKTMEDGQLEPIVINSKNEILSGNLRYLAAKHLGWDSLDAIVDESTGDEACRIVSITSTARKATTLLSRRWVLFWAV